MVGGQGQGHDVARVPVEHRHLLACLHLDEKEFTFLDKYVLCMYKITLGFYVNFSRKKNSFFNWKLGILSVSLIFKIFFCLCKIQIATLFLNYQKS